MLMILGSFKFHCSHHFVHLLSVCFYYVYNILLVDVNRNNYAGVDLYPSTHTSARGGGRARAQREGERERERERRAC